MIIIVPNLTEKKRLIEMLYNYDQHYYYYLY